MITLTRVVQTCIACPSQWNAWDAEGNYYYLRYRHGYGEVRQYRSEKWWESDDPREHECLGRIAEFEHGDPLDGVISLEEFAELAGLGLSPELMETGFGDHLRDELVTEHGFAFLLDDDDTQGE